MDALNQFAAGGFGDIVSFVGNFLVLLILAAILFFVALRTGKTMLVCFILSLYVAFALFTVFPFKETFVIGDTALMKAVSSLLLFGVCTFFPYMLLQRIATSGSLRINPIALAIVALATGGFVLAIGYHLLHIADLIPLTPSLDALFAPDKYFFWWFLAPLASIFITTR